MNKGMLRLREEIENKKGGGHLPMSVLSVPSMGYVLKLKRSKI